MKIVTNRTELMQPVKVRKISAHDVDKYSKILKSELAKHGGVGLSANQLGIDVRMCIINVTEPIILVNPVILEQSDRTNLYAEQCLSITSTLLKPKKTLRSERIKINTDNLGIIEFEPEFSKEGRRWKSPDEYYSDTGLLECVTVQHEIDHLNGILMTHSRRRFSTTIEVPETFGRNEKVMVEFPDGTTDFIKFKKVKALQENKGAKIISI